MSSLILGHSGRTTLLRRLLTRFVYDIHFPGYDNDSGRWVRYQDPIHVRCIALVAAWLHVSGTSLKGTRSAFSSWVHLYKEDSYGSGFLRDAKRTDFILSRPKAGLMVMSYSGRLTNSDLMKGRNYNI